MLKLGYKASAEQFAPTKLLDFSIEAEKVELDSVFVSDHFQPWKHVDGHAPSSLVWLGALAARTSSLMIGTSVLTPTFRYHPSIVAQAFGTLGSMAPGRVILGIGTGESLNEVPSTGQPWPEFKERFARMREAVTLIRTLWRGERISFEGEYYKTEKATIYDRPNVEIPIYVAAAGAVVARYAGRTGDGFICTSGKKWDLYTETLMPSVAEGIGKATEPKKRPYDNMIEIKLSFDEFHVELWMFYRGASIDLGEDGADDAQALLDADPDLVLARVRGRIIRGLASKVEAWQTDAGQQAIGVSFEH